jgi:hypothetical protein
LALQCLQSLSVLLALLLALPPVLLLALPPVLLLALPLVLPPALLLVVLLALLQTLHALMQAQQGVTWKRHRKLFLLQAWQAVSLMRHRKPSWWQLSQTVKAPHWMIMMLVSLTLWQSQERICGSVIELLQLLLQETWIGQLSQESRPLLLLARPLLQQETCLPETQQEWPQPLLVTFVLQWLETLPQQRLVSEQPLQAPVLPLLLVTVQLLLLERWPSPLQVIWLLQLLLTLMLQCQRSWLLLLEVSAALLLPVRWLLGLQKILVLKDHSLVCPHQHYTNQSGPMEKSAAAWICDLLPGHHHHHLPAATPG